MRLFNPNCLPKLRIITDFLHYSALSMDLVGRLQFVNVAVQAILDPADDPKECSLADLSPVFRTVDVREQENSTPSDPS